MSDPGSIIEFGALILRSGQEPEVRHGMTYPGCLAEPRTQQVYGFVPEEYLEAESPRVVHEVVLGDVLDLQSLPYSLGDFSTDFQELLENHRSMSLSTYGDEQ